MFLRSSLYAKSVCLWRRAKTGRQLFASHDDLAISMMARLDLPRPALALLCQQPAGLGMHRNDPWTSKPLLHTREITLTDPFPLSLNLTSLTLPLAYTQ